MSGVHGTLGWLAVGAAVIVTVTALSTWLLGTRRPARVVERMTDILVALVTALVFAALFVGGLLLMAGSRPSDMLHVVYGTAALATLPAAMALGIWFDQGRRRGPRRYLWVAAGGLVLAVLALLLTRSG